MTAPERICIHIERYEDHAQYDPYWQIPHGADYEVGYIRHDAEALAASPVVQDMIRQAVEAEREACARVCEEWGAWNDTAQHIAAAIRARKGE